MRRTNFIYAIYIFCPERSILELFQLGLVGLAEKRSCPGSSWIGRGKRAPRAGNPERFARSAGVWQHVTSGLHSLLVGAHGAGEHAAERNHMDRLRYARRFGALGARFCCLRLGCDPALPSAQGCEWLPNVDAILVSSACRSPSFVSSPSGSSRSLRRLRWWSASRAVCVASPLQQEMMRRVGELAPHRQ